MVPRLRGLGRMLRLYVLIDGLAVVFGALVAVLLITLFIDYTFRLTWDMRLVQLSSLAAVLAAITWREVVRPLRRRIGASELAVLVERRFPHLQSRLVSAVEFIGESGADEGGGPPADRGARRSPALMEAVVRQAGTAAADLRFTETLAHDRFRRRAAVMMACMAIVAVMGLTQRDLMGLWLDRNLLLREVPWPQRNRLTVEGLENGRMVVPRGDDVTLLAVVDEGYRPPLQTFIEYGGSGGFRGREQMLAVIGEDHRFTHTFERINATLECRIVGGDARTEPFKIEVVERPRVADVVIHIEPPSYTRADPYELRPGQTVAEALKGSRVGFRIRTNKPVRGASLVRQVAGREQEIGPAERVGDQGYVAFDTPEQSATYHFHLEDELGLTNRGERVVPVRFSVRLLADKAPRVRMRVRGAGEMVTRDAVLPVEVECADEFGLASAGLAHRAGDAGNGSEREPVVEPISGFEPGTVTFTQSLDWSVAARRFSEGDRFTLVAQAEDFDDVSGPNLGTSQTFMFRIVSREELMAELNRREQEYRQDFERLLRLQEELYAELLTLSGEADGSEDRSRQLVRLARRQRDHAGRMNTLRMQFEQVMSELRVNQMSSPTVEYRLGEGVAEPLGRLSRSEMPDAADRIDRLSRSASAEEVAAARDAQEAILAEMNRILANMVKWEGFQEAVALLREVMKMQGELNQETEKRIEAEIFGLADEEDDSGR